MTLKQTITTIKAICKAHQQIRSFVHNPLDVEWLNDKKSDYPAVFLQDSSANISTTGHATTLSFRLFILDLVNVDEETNTNSLDVRSDMLSIGQDLIAQMNYPTNNWILSADNNTSWLIESENDMLAGVVIDFSVRLIYPQDVCAVPSNYILQ